MPVLYPVWSECFDTVAPFAKKTSKAAFAGFVREFEQWKYFWDNALPDDPDMKQIKPTLRLQIPATYQEELDELLLIAVKSCKQKSLILLAAGASANVRSRFSKKRAVLHVAEKGDTVLMQAFIDNGVDLMMDTYTPLMTAAAANSLEMVKLLVEHGVEVGDQDLPVSVWSNKIEIVEYMVSKGVDINRPAKHDLRTALHSIRCTNPICSGTERMRFPNTMQGYAGQSPLAENKIPLTFASCNRPMYDLLVRLGLDVTLQSMRQTVCKRGLHENQENLMNDRRMAVAMALHERLGALALVGRIDQEVVRMILVDGTPRVLH
jgi:DNA-binding transcriptional regulator/RsmH inhibitor MraZ